MDFAVGTGQFLGLRAVTPIADAEEQVPFLIEHDPAAVMMPRGAVRLVRGLVDHLLVRPGVVPEPPANEAGHGPGTAAARSVEGVAVGQVNPAGIRVVRVHRHVQEAALAFIEDRRGPLDRFGL